MYPEHLHDSRIPDYPKVSEDERKEPTKAFVMKNYSIGMHRQGFYEVNIVLSGTGYVLSPGARASLRRNTAKNKPQRIRGMEPRQKTRQNKHRG